MMQFTCPVCKHHDLLEMVTECTALVESVGIDPETGEPKLKDEPQYFEGLDNTYFRCGWCDYSLRLSGGDFVRDFDDLKDWLKENQKEEGNG